MENITTLRQQNEQLKAQLLNTSLIHELTKVLHSCTNLQDIIKTLLLAMQEIIEFDRVILFTINRENFCLQPESSVGIPDEDICDFTIPLGFSGGEITDALFLNRHILVEKPDAVNDHFKTKLKSSSYLAIPLIKKVNRKCWETKSCTKTACPAHGGYNPYCWSINGSGLLIDARDEDERRAACIACPCFKVEGVLWMDRNTKNTPITSDDITIVTASVTMAGIVIENFNIFDALEKANISERKINNKLKLINNELQVANARINRDLDHARTIQQGLLPQDLEDTPEVKIGTYYLSADAVGGDYYDVFNIEPGIYGLVVADVSGHGVASALIMSMGKILLKTFSRNEHSPQKTLERINQTFLSEIKTDHFVTFFYAILDTNNHLLRFTSAGHCPIILLDRSTGAGNLIKADGLFLGVFPDMMLHESEISYKPGTIRMVLYTDGLIEAKKPNDEMYGFERLRSISEKTLDKDVKTTVYEILKDQKIFCAENTSPEDDITLLVIDF
ncbi:MAG: serine/threonine-protein phosphatase [Chitinispirillaceae bacterium]|nr:serine/threonine-protein phosphatase [Chitinispirillaceae bacterium]